MSDIVGTSIRNIPDVKVRKVDIKADVTFCYTNITIESHSDNAKEAVIINDLIVEVIDWFLKNIVEMIVCQTTLEIGNYLVV